MKQICDIEEGEERDDVLDNETIMMREFPIEGDDEEENNDDEEKAKRWENDTKCFSSSSSSSFEVT